MRRVSIAEIVEETGLSRATVDRVLNHRGRVHPRTREVVEATLRRLMAPEEHGPAAGPAADFVMRVGKGMIAQMRSAWDAAGVSGRFTDMYMAPEDDVLREVEALCRDTSRPLIITVKNTDRLVDQLREARHNGKRVIAAVSDLAHDARDAFVGIDNRAAGQTAAYLIGRSLGDRQTAVGVVLGNLAFRCHEDREIGFRTCLRAHFPKVVLSGEAQGEDNADLTREAVLRMIEDNPAISAIYNLGGGNVGLVDALRSLGREDMLVVVHEVNAVTAPLLRAGSIDFAMAGDPAVLLGEALRLAAVEAGAVLPGTGPLDFAVYTRFNLPSFAQAF
jgi:LacI family transcriptional regulator